MKYFLLIMLMIPTVIFAEDSSVFDDGTWYYGKDTVTTYKHKPVPFDGHINDHSLIFSIPDNMEGKSDLCWLSSPTALNCPGNYGATYDKDKHTVTVTNGYDSFTYYQRDEMPKQSIFVGKWERDDRNEGTNACGSWIHDISIPYNKADATELFGVVYCAQGSCSKETYHVVKDPIHGVLYIGPSVNMVYPGFYLYDANNHPIVDFKDLDTVAKLNDGLSGFPSQYDSRCDLKKVQSS